MWFTRKTCAREGFMADANVEGGLYVRCVPGEDNSLERVCTMRLPLVVASKSFF